jgi:hypothetical protein
MKRIVTTLIAVAITTFAATSVSAHIVEVTLSIPVTKASNRADLKVAVESAVDEALQGAIGFTPTVVTVQSARRIGDRIYLQLLIVDQDGEALMKQLAIDSANESDEPSSEDVDDGVETL